MSSPRQTLRRVSARIQGRFRSARPGSVLILVVALLVMMALIGTAWLSTARIDRYAVRQSAANTQIDLLVDGVVNMDKAAHLDDVTDGVAGRPAIGNYGHYDHSAADGFIASRTPVVFREVCPMWTAGEISHAVEPGFTPAGADAPRPRKYYEGQFVWYDNAGSIEYYVCRWTHTVDTTAPPDPAVPTHDAPPATTHPYWRLVGIEGVFPPTDDTLPAPGAEVYSMTPVWPAITRLFTTDRFVDVADATRLPFANRTVVIPTYMNFAGDTKFPAFRLYSSNAFPGAPSPWFRGGLITVPAADSDGDGVADAALFKLDVGTLDGVDYYAGVRVIDNNAAVNFNTANSAYADLDFGGAWDTRPTILGFMGAFLGNVGFREMLNPHQDPDADLGARGAEVAAMNRVRYRDGTATPRAGDDSGAPDNVVFRTQYEALEMQVARRLGNPGINIGAGPLVTYNPFSTINSAALAFRGGVLRNVDASPSAFENALSGAVAITGVNDPDSTHYDPVYDRAPNRGTLKFMTYKEATRDYPRQQHPYDDASAPGTWPTFICRWFDENYNQWGYTDNTGIPPAQRPFNNPTGAFLASPPRLLMGPDYNDTMALPTNPMRRPIRPLLVAKNPLSSQATLKAAGLTISADMGPIPAVQPRASVNTSGFAELWRAYFCVMANEWPTPTNQPGLHTPFSEAYRYMRDVLAPPDPYGAGSWHNNPYNGMAFFSDLGASPQEPDFSGAAFVPLEHPARMFRSVLRPNVSSDAMPWTNDTPRLQPDQVLLLRSAIAAANALALRDNDLIITPIDVTIPVSTDATRNTAVFAGDDTPALSVRIYGTEPQPFISEVYANTDTEARTNIDQPALGLANANGYVAIELCNPYPIPIDIRNCKFATINRQDYSRNVAAGPTSPARPDYLHDYTVDKHVVIDRTTDPVVAQRVPVDEQIILTPDTSLPADDPAQPIVSNMEDLTVHGPTIIPPAIGGRCGFLVLENYDARTSPHARAATYRPPSLGVTGPNGLPGEHPGQVDKDDAKVGLRNFAFVRNLDRVLNQEFVLVRPNFAVTDGTGLYNSTPGYAPMVRYDIDTRAGVLPNILAVDMTPLDSFDFTGLRHPSEGAARMYAWHYARASRPETGKAWHFVYPGRYDANKSVPDPTGEQRPRQQGTDEAGELDPATREPLGVVGWPAGTMEPWEEFTDAGGNTVGRAPQPSFSFGWDEAEAPMGTLRPSEASYPREFPIQIANIGFAGPAGAPGAFLRNGDILQIPFIGAYRIKMAGQSYEAVLELNALPMDASFAEDSDPTNDPPSSPGGDILGVRREQIGRFCPLPASDLSVAARGTIDGSTLAPASIGDAERREVTGYWSGGGPNGRLYDLVITSGPNRGRSRSVLDYTNAGAGGVMTSYSAWAGTAADIPGPGTSYELRHGNYRWATDLFNYLTVHSPHADLLSNLPGGTAVSNYGSAANGAGEVTAPVEGLININTAPWRVLASIPWMYPTPVADQLAYNDGLQERPTAPGVFTPGLIVAGLANGVPDNYDIARAIVAYRDSEIAAGADPNRVFTSLFDLYRVPGILNIADLLFNGSAADPDDGAGDLSPDGTNVDGVRGDFEEQYQFITRVSNIITTRSDSFTNYIVVQGWRGIGQPGVQPELVVQRRKSFMTDRSRVSSSVRDVETQFFFNE